MRSRLWYPQLDVASTARRLVRLLSRWNKDELSLERLFVADYFLASPELIADIKMPGDLRKEFTAKKFPRKKDSFVIFPSPGVLFHSMNPIQTKALVSLVAKDVVDHRRYSLGQVTLTEAGINTAGQLASFHVNELEEATLTFLERTFRRKEFSTKADLRSRTGLRYYG